MVISNISINQTLTKANILTSTYYIPHGHCYLWQTPLVWLHLYADLFTALAYYSIPIMLVYFVSQRKETPFRSIFVLFGAFILSCGTSHLAEIWTLWHADYWFSGTIKALTALISIYTAISLVTLIPQAIALPSPAELENLNQALQEQIKNREEKDIVIRELNKKLEQKVFERTEQLEITNQQLNQEIAERKKIEASLKENQYFTAKVIKLTPNIVYVYDLIENRSVYSNDFVNRLLGYNPLEMQGMHNKIVDMLIHADDQERVNKYHQECIDLKEEETREIEYKIRDNQGKWHWLRSEAASFEKMPNGQTKQIISCAINITERKKIELKLDDLNSQLSERIHQLERNTQEMIQMGRITDFLQACSTVTEAQKALPDLLKELFGESTGAVMMVKSPAEEEVETVGMWGDNLDSELNFNRSDCWGLNSGKTYEGKNTDYPSLCCHHVQKSQELAHTLCIPMIAQGEALGLVYLNFQSNKYLMQLKRNLAETVAKQMAIALANLKLRETLEKQSFLDPLTGLYNRRYMEIQLEQQIKGKNLGLIILDIDFFKKINDTYGHEAGDLVLCTIGKQLQEELSSSTSFCRYGGEEFVLIVPNTLLEDLLKMSEELRTAVKKLSIEYQDVKLENITASFGVTWFCEKSITSEKLLRLADQALYQAKRQGRDRVIYLDDQTQLSISPPNNLSILNSNSFLIEGH